MKHKQITLTKLKTLLVAHFPLLAKISLSTLSKTIRRKMNMAHRKFSTRFIPASTNSFYEVYKSTSRILLTVDYLMVDVISIDEYALNYNLVNKYSWTLKGNEEYIF